jgi:hypothetical protein
MTPPYTKSQNKNKSHKMYKKKLLSFLIISCSIPYVLPIDCTKLRVGQFICPDPDSSYDYIDHKTQSVAGCKKDGTASVRCIASEGIVCEGFENNTFYGSIPCDYT